MTVRPGGRSPARLLTAALAITATGCDGRSPSFRAVFPPAVDRVWIGPDFHANRLQDWRLREGRIESVEGSAAKPMRTLHLLTRSLREERGTLRLSVRTGPLEPGPAHGDTWSGFLLGVGGKHVDYRISALSHHWPSTDGGLIVAVDGTGRIVVRDNAQHHGHRGPDPDIPTEHWPLLEPDLEERQPEVGQDVRLVVEATPAGEAYRLEVTVFDPETDTRLVRSTYSGIEAGKLSGNVALVSHRSPRMEGPGYWFRDWQLSGSKVERHEERTLGPVLGTLYTLSRGTLKMTAQLAPLGPADASLVRLELRREGRWASVDEAEIQPLSATAHFRVDEWTGDVDVPYRVAYGLTTAQGEEPHYYEGLIRRAPSGDEPFVLAAFTGQHISGGDGQWNSSHFWWPHPEVTSGVAFQDPDMLFFSGDQIYETGLEGVVREPTDVAALDYLNHWYRFVWAFRDLTRDRPTVTIPDDHDAYHGNIWGNGGVREPGDHTVQDAGGYRMPPEWVNAMHRTQVAHLPDPVDPEPLANGITTYHTRIEYGGMSFAVLADRMWKSPPSVAVPEGDVVNGWPQRPGFDAATQADVPGASLLGDRQERFLEEWANDWSGGGWMKVVLSQTPFADVATIPEEATSGAALPGSYIVEPGEYLEGEKLAQDMDSNGWPQTARNRALRSMRKGFAFHVAGDQHLAHSTHYGVDAWNDAGQALTVPSIANLWPRRWFPPEPGRNPMPWSSRNTGEYLDGFGNRVTVLAVANPTQVDLEPRELYQRAPGWGLVRFHRATRQIVTEVWPRWVDPSAPGAEPYPGWPLTGTQSDQYGREPAGHLADIVVWGMEDPVVQVVEESTGEIVYTLRIAGDRFRPPVFDAAGTYSVVVGEPGTDRRETLTGLRPSGEERPTVYVDFR